MIIILQMLLLLRFIALWYKAKMEAKFECTRVIFVNFLRFKFDQKFQKGS